MKITKELSDSINLLITKMTTTDFDKLSKLIEFRSFNGSFFPFIGSKWNNVDFSNNYCHIAYVEIKRLNRVTVYVGFNEDLNFDHYPYFTMTDNDWNSIKTILLNIYYEYHNINPKYNKIDNWLRQINQYLIAFSSRLEIIRD